MGLAVNRNLEYSVIHFGMCSNAHTFNLCLFISPGLVSTLNGLNIANNPLEFPPQSVIDGGTSQILHFMRELLRAKSQAGNPNGGR